MRNALIVIVAVLVVLFLFSRHPSTSVEGSTQPDGGTTTGHLSVVPTVRSVTVSPGDVTFGNCTGGGGSTDSTAHAMGYPNGTCGVGSTGAAGQSYPITIKYSGIPGEVYVAGSNAVPADNGTPWTLCTPNPRTGSGLLACKGDHGQPGNDQYMVSNFAADQANANVLGSSAACDLVFEPGGGCVASPAQLHSQVAHEGLLLTGPSGWDDHSTDWTITVTWTAVGPNG